MQLLGTLSLWCFVAQKLVVPKDVELSSGCSESISGLKLELGVLRARVSLTKKKQKFEFQGGFNKRGCRVVSSVILDVKIFLFFLLFFFFSFLHPLSAHACNSVLTLPWETCLYNYDLMVDCIDWATGSKMVFFLSSFS